MATEAGRHACLVRRGGKAIIDTLLDLGRDGLVGITVVKQAADAPSKGGVLAQLACTVLIS